MTFDIDGLLFDIPSDWRAAKYDDWAFYRKRFIRTREKTKAADLIAIDPARTLWFIEGKDYRKYQRTKPSELHEEIAGKVLDTLAALLPAAVNGDDFDEKVLARHALRAERLRVVLHLEQPRKHSKLFPRAIDPADVQQRLRKLIKPVDPHPQVVEMAKMGSLAWSVR